MSIEITAPVPPVGTAPNKRRMLHDLNRRLVMSAPLVPPSPEIFSKPKAVERWTFNLKGRPVDRTIIYLRSDVGCEYGVKTGGCTGCRHWRLGTAGTRVNLDNMFVRQYEAAVADNGYSPVVCLYNEGNLLNDRELPSKQLHYMVSDLQAHGVERVILESRVEYITPLALESLRRAAPDIEIEMGIGLESSSSFIRNELFLKSLSLESYDRALERLHQYDIKALAYVILKPAFLNEAQGLKDTISTVDYAFNVGTDVVSVEPIGVEPHTVTALLERAGHFKPAWLWTVIEVAKMTRSLGEVRLGGFQFMPRPKSLPQNCSICTPSVLKSIDAYNHTYDISHIENLRCEHCTSIYENEINSCSSELDEERIARALADFVSRHEKLELAS